LWKEEKIMNRAVRVYYHFGSFRLDVAARVLLRDGELVPLTPKIFETLLLLLQYHGKIVEREQLIQTVWPDNYVEEGNISSTIYLLRKALGDNRNGQNYIATVPRRGYRFIAPVREFCVAEQTSAVLASGAIAVLPFRSLSFGESDEGWGLGLADALITQLSQCRKLTVRPTSAVRKYMRMETNPVTAGQELGTELIVECNFQRLGESIRVTAQLISVRDDAPLWASTYDEQFTTLFALEDSISKKIASDLIVELLEEATEEDHRQYAGAR
jgi:DNA-binding winged helix-turn-helix (wHTH) protein